mgnify:CR=1 FL=1
MTIEIINPKDEKHWLELRTKVLTSTEIPALFGLSPYCTLFELWQRKKNNYNVEFDPNERSDWGLILQEGIAKKFAKDNKWEIRRMDEFIQDNDLRIGSSFDYAIGNDGILEVKNVDGLVFKDNWIEDDVGNIEEPPHIGIQVQVQLAMSKRDFAFIGALVSGNKGILIKRTPEPSIIAAIKKRVSEFWASIDNDTPPSPNLSEDSEFIKRLYSYAEPGKIFDARSDSEIETLVKEYKELGGTIKTADERRDAIKADILMRIGDAEKVLGNGFSITAGTVGPAHVEYERSAYRMFKVNTPRGKK